VRHAQSWHNVLLAKVIGYLMIAHVQMDILMIQFRSIAKPAPLDVRNA